MTSRIYRIPQLNQSLDKLREELTQRLGSTNFTLHHEQGSDAVFLGFDTRDIDATEANPDWILFTIKYGEDLIMSGILGDADC